MPSHDAPQGLGTSDRRNRDLPHHLHPAPTGADFPPDIPDLHPQPLVEGLLSLRAVASDKPGNGSLPSGLLCDSEQAT